MKININDEIIVRLTPAGEAAWVKYWNELTDNGGVVPSSIREHATLKDGRVHFQLWTAMAIFGDDCYNGSKTLPFVDNSVEIPRPR